MKQDKVVKKTKKQHTHANGFHKDIISKLDHTLLPVEALRETTKCLEYGAKKYGRDNWRKCKDNSMFVKAIYRHLLCIVEGEIIDPETGLEHSTHIATNAMFLTSLRKQNGN
jgi:hypothetical protein